MSHTAAVRRFYRFYTRQIGILRQGYLDSPFSLSEVRVLYEITHRDRPTAAAIAKDLDLDPGYLSRMLARFEKRRLIARRQESDDARRSTLQLTAPGRAAFAPLERTADRGIKALLSKLAPPQRRSLIQSMNTIENLLTPSPEASSAPFVIRTHRPGDMGWVIHRHGVLYAQEYGWNEVFEAEVAEIAAHFVKHFDPQRERCWIAEKDGAIIGCIFLVRKTDRIGKLRLFLIEPSARGLGLGKRLVTECIGFARQAGYRQITLWTQSNLYAARHIYSQHGFRRVHRERHPGFGFPLMTETWELEL
jgi:DNA-binding MarR family transcriptional regulator/GNAT superfamily N-acetyltransferase